MVQLESIDTLVTDFNEIRVQHDHYRLKVEDLGQKVREVACARVRLRVRRAKVMHAQTCHVECCFLFMDGQPLRPPACPLLPSLLVLS